ncbi:MAG: peroxiredoxin family protein [Kofleriaceae bacterium]|nr:peroxiredoxin family protein [Kofleriaceae bacterium]
MCQEQLVELQKDIKEIEATGIRVVAISYDPADKLAAFARSKKIEFPLLADPDSATIKSYGLLNKDGYAHPGTYLIDKKGIIRKALFLKAYQNRHSNATLIEAASELK